MGVKWDRAIPSAPVSPGGRTSRDRTRGCRIRGVDPERSLMTMRRMDILAEPASWTVRSVRSGVVNVPGIIVKEFPQPRSITLLLFSADPLGRPGTPPFGVAAGTYLTCVMNAARVYAFHRRTVYPRVAGLDASMWYAPTPRRRVGPRRARPAGGARAQVLLACLRSKSKMAPRVYGHRVHAGGSGTSPRFHSFDSPGFPKSW